MSSVIDKFEQELKNTDYVAYVQNGGDDADEIIRLSKRGNMLRRIINTMKTLKLSESTWNKFTHEEIEEIAHAFDAVIDEFKSDEAALYQTIQDWEDWAERRPY